MCRRAEANRRTARWRCGLVVAIALATPGLDAEPIQVRAGQPFTSIVDRVDYLEDRDARRQLEDLLADPSLDWQEPRGRELNLGRTQSALWIRFDLANTTDSPAPLFLEVGYPQLDHVELFEEQRDGGFRSWLLGDTLPFHQRLVLSPNFVFPLELAPQSTRSYYLRVETGGTLSVPLAIGGSIPYLQQIQHSQLVLGLFYGIFIGTTVYNLFLLLVLRQPIYFYLVGHTASLGMVFANFDGLAFRLWPSAVVWHQWAIFVFISLLSLFTMLFVRRLIDSATIYPRFDRALGAAGWLLVVTTAASALGGLRVFFAVTLAWLIGVASSLAVTVLWHARRHRPARIYAVGWGLMLLAIAGTAVAGLGWFPNFRGALWMIKTVAAGEVLLAAMAVAGAFDQTRRALAASEEKYTRAFQFSPDAITITTTEDGRFLEVNDNFAKISGYSRDEAIGRTSGELGLWLKDARAGMIEILRRDGRVHDLPIEIQQKGGGSCPVLFSAAPIEVDGKASMVAVVRDMTELEEASEQREVLIRRLEAQNAELERFAYTVSHDLKSPLVTIGGFVGLLERELQGQDVEKQGAYLERIRTASQRMGVLLDELLELSRVGHVIQRSGEVALAEIAEEAGALVAEALRERGVTLCISPEMPTVTCDRTRLLEVFQNLLENAVRFLGDQAEPRIEIGSRKADNEVVCYVRDNGIGIAPEHHEKIFGLFARLASEVEGTGIGLALVKRIIESHGGRIWVESEGLGRGSTFCFVIPPLTASRATPAGDSP